MPRPSRTDDELARAVGDLIRRARTARGWSQELLAEGVGVQPRTLARYESGKIAVNLPMLYALAAELQLEPAALLPRSESDDPVTRVVEAWGVLDPESRALVAGLLERLTR